MEQPFRGDVIHIGKDFEGTMDEGTIYGRRVIVDIDAGSCRKTQAKVPAGVKHDRWGTDQVVLISHLLLLSVAKRHLGLVYVIPGMNV